MSEEQSSHKRLIDRLHKERERAVDRERLLRREIELQQFMCTEPHRRMTGECPICRKQLDA